MKNYGIAVAVSRGRVEGELSPQMGEIMSRGLVLAKRRLVGLLNESDEDEEIVDERFLDTVDAAIEWWTEVKNGTRANVALDRDPKKVSGGIGTLARDSAVLGLRFGEDFSDCFTGSAQSLVDLRLLFTMIDSWNSAPMVVQCDPDGDE